MKNSNLKISTKIKIYGFVLISLMMVAIIITIYFNNKNVNDSQLINIAGQQRMLTQRISKDIFYINESKSLHYNDLYKSIDKFVTNLKYIKDEDEIKELIKLPHSRVALQIKKVDELWNDFYKDIKRFQILMKLPHSDYDVKNLLEHIYDNSNILLVQVHELVIILTIRNEQKNNYIKNLQYIAAFFLLILMFYIVSQLKHIEKNAHQFMEYSKNLASSSDIMKIRPIHSQAEEELLEMDAIVQSFAHKINSAIDFSNEALSQSEQASAKLEEISHEFDHLLDEVFHHTDASEKLNNSEDMMIESTEELLNSTKKLYMLKDELNKLLAHCNPNTLK